MSRILLLDGQPHGILLEKRSASSGELLPCSGFEAAVAVRGGTFVRPVGHTMEQNSGDRYHAVDMATPKGGRRRTQRSRMWSATGGQGGSRARGEYDGQPPRTSVDGSVSWGRTSKRVSAEGSPGLDSGFVSVVRDRWMVFRRVQMMAKISSYPNVDGLHEGMVRNNPN
ncbi:uncharacterized protein LOC144116321 [Amblyomma americanum]